MFDLQIPKDAVSHGQIKSKIWLLDNLKKWSSLYFKDSPTLSLYWYGCWVGMGVFLAQTCSGTRFHKIHLFDIDENNLDTAKKLLDFWHCEGSKIYTYCLDVNIYKPESLDHHQVFINTSCEHMNSYEWLCNIPTSSYVLLQSTNMPHHEHCNLKSSLTDFLDDYSKFLEVLDSGELEFKYPDKTFSRYMLFGKKK